MESKKLEALLMAVDLGSFTKAAEVLGYTQSGLTHMMNSLEKEVGFTLLERGRSGVRLTEEGERIAPAVREFLQANARLDSVIEQVASSRTEIIRVSAYASIAMHWLPGIIQRFREECEKGLAIRYGGAMDGIEVVAVIFAKPLGLSVGTFVLIYNVLLYIICGIVMGSWILPLYSIVTYAAGSKTVDFIVDGLDSAKAAMIITTHPDEIARAVSDEFGTGLTIIDAHGFYSDTPKTVLYVVVNRFQTVTLKTLVKGVDANAYMAISPVADLLHGSKEEETA